MMLCMHCYRQIGIAYNELCFQCYKRIGRLPHSKAAKRVHVVEFESKTVESPPRRLISAEA